jgi:hypothetical protein
MKHEVPVSGTWRMGRRDDGSALTNARARHNGGWLEADCGLLHETLKARPGRARARGRCSVKWPYLKTGHCTFFFFFPFPPAY